jgi:hypothetical protein
MNRINMAPSKSICCASMQDLAASGGKLLSLSIHTSLKFMQAVLDIVTPAVSNMKMPSLSAVCDIPETACPPRCVCTIHWDACRGERRQHAIHVTNTSKRDVAFKLKATPLGGLDGGSDLIVLQPEQLVLKAGESGLSMASITIPDNAPSGEYHAEILVQGGYEQCVRVLLTVGDSNHCVCQVSQGDIPVRIRAHHWYDHFQCVEPCFEPIHTKSEDRQTESIAPVKRPSTGN